jgi:hypothetical protein
MKNKAQPVYQTILSVFFVNPVYSVRTFSGFFYIIFLGLIFFPAAAGAQNWYRSNQAGMALEGIASRMVALHYEWALYVERAGYNSLPPLLRSYYNASYAMEQRLLYERGKLKRRQWIFRDARGITRVNASLPADPAFAGKTEGGEIPPFVEIFSSSRMLTEVHQYLASGVYTTRYSYREGLLVKAETFLDSVPLWTDNYRYSRKALLRGVERNYHEAGSYAQSLQGTNSSPPTVPASIELREVPPISGFVSPVVSYDNSIMTDVLGSIYSVKAERVVYDTDSQGRVLTETRYDKDDNVLAVINNEWAGDRIAQIRWTGGSDEGRIVFRYSGKDRVSEEDYRNGVLERKVFVRGDEEIEEIYMNGKVILRAVWKDGRKLSEKRVRP